MGSEFGHEVPVGVGGPPDRVVHVPRGGAQAGAGKGRDHRTGRHRVGETFESPNHPWRVGVAHQVVGADAHRHQARRVGKVSEQRELFVDHMGRVRS